MKEANCNLCNSKSVKLLFRVRDWNIYSCNICSFVFVHPGLSNKQLNKLYKEFVGNIFEKSKVIQNDSKHSIQLLDKYKYQRSTLLDVGCGSGIFLNEAINHNWICSGLEISRELVNYLRKFKKFEVIHKDILSIKPSNKFDVITLNQVIEHFSKPRLVIRKCRKLLNRNGLIYIATPNISSIVSLVRKQNFDYIIPPEHLSYFNRSTLERILIEEKYRILIIKTWSYPVDLAGLVKHFLKRNVNKTQNSTPETQVKQTILKQIKYILFDKLFCSFFYKLLNFNYGGTMIEVVAIKE